MKYALIIGNNKYDDRKLAQLKTPAADSQALAKILDDQTIGSFDEVTPLINQTETRVRRAISAFLTNKKPDDLVLLYFSGHGVLDDRGRLYLALKDTQVDLLKATSIPSSFVADEMDSCRSRRQILILDCCHSGAFGRGTKGEQKAITEVTFEGSGFGRVVLTASDSTQYALEGDQVIKQTDLSLFTHFLLDGLQTGAADLNNDGLIALDEWYDYTYTRVVSETPKQVPHKWSYNQQGDLVIAKNPFRTKKIAELPAELLQALESSFVGIRESAVNELGKYLQARDSELVELAISSLQKMEADDSRRISSLATKLLSEFRQAQAPSPAVVSSIPLPGEPTDGTIPVSLETAQTSAEMPAQQPLVEKTNQMAVPGLDRSVWGKWIGTTILGIVLSVLLGNYHMNTDGSAGTVRILFGVVAALTGLTQWGLFRDRLELWWVAANAVTGLGLGIFHQTLFDSTGWGHEDLILLLVAWVIVNFVVGLLLLRSPQQTSWSPIIESGARQNIFLFLLSIALIFAALSNTLLVFQQGNYLPTVWKLYAISAIVTSLTYFFKKDVPRNIGFISLAIFLFFDGFNIWRYALNSSYPQYYFILSAIPALVAVVFFFSQRVLWRNFGFMMASVFLLSTALAGLIIYNTGLEVGILGVSVFFAIPAAIYFLLRKQLPAHQMK